MTPFQWILVSAIAGLGVVSAIAIAKGKIGRPAGIAWIAVLLVALLAAIDPERVTKVANAVGINRGADLVLYLLALAVFWGFLLVYIRLRRVRRELTLVVRRLAVMEAEEGGAGTPRRQEP
ncbi:MAG: DUF2304 family protein [Phycisphaerales bacterium]|jgi:hypothetical protein